MTGLTVRAHLWRHAAMPPFAADPGLACHPGNAHLFHPQAGEREPGRQLREKEARAVCRRCPARDDCADWALTHPNLGGTWGGLSEHDRGMRRKPHRATRGNKDAA